MSEKESTVRKVFILPYELVDRIQQYRFDHNIDSEVEAVRRLLDSALLHRDNTVTILGKMLARYEQEKDIRVIARDVLATHPLVESIHYYPSSLRFTVKDNLDGSMTNEGKTFVHRGDSRNEIYFDKDGRLAELDDDIPF